MEKVSISLGFRKTDLGVQETIAHSIARTS